MLLRRCPPTRTITYSYDGLQRLIGAQESPGTSYGYQYDLAAGCTQVAVNGTTTQQYTYDAAGYPRAGDVQGWSYGTAGNPTQRVPGDGTATNTYDDTRARAPGWLTDATVGAQGTSYSYNGDGTQVGETSGERPPPTPRTWRATSGYPLGGDLAIVTGSGTGAVTATGD